MDKYLYRAEFDFYGDFYFERYKIIRETECTYVIEVEGKTKYALKDKNCKKAFARTTLIEAFNDLYVKTQISLNLLKKREKRLEDKIKRFEFQIKKYDVKQKEIKHGNKKIIIDDSENIEKMDNGIFEETDKLLWNFGNFNH